MKWLDSRSTEGGFLPLQDHRAKEKVEGRSSILAARAIDDDEFGIVIADRNTRGDVNGGQFWPAVSRSIGMWRFAYPVRRVYEEQTAGTDDGGGSGGSGAGIKSFYFSVGSAPGTIVIGGSTYTLSSGPINQYSSPGGATVAAYQYTLTSGPGEAGGTGDEKDVPAGLRPGSKGPETVVLPTLGPLYEVDTRMLKKTIPTRGAQPYWPAFPADAFGIVLATDDEGVQIDEYMPTDPRLVAVHRGVDTACGSLVCDLRNTDPRFDPTRSAKLQSAFWVVKEPKGILRRGGLSAGQTGAPPPIPQNEIAWNIGFSGRHDVLGGLFADQEGSQVVVFGSASFNDGGPLNPGGQPTVLNQQGDGGGTASSDEQHVLGKDADGHAINAGHLSTHSLFRGRAVGSTNQPQLGGTVTPSPRNPNPPPITNVPYANVAGNQSFGTRGTADGPILFESSYPTTQGDQLYIVNGHIAFDGRFKYTWPEPKGAISAQGAWRIWTTYVYGLSTPPGPPIEFEPPTFPPRQPTLDAGGQQSPGTAGPPMAGEPLVGGWIDPVVGRIASGNSKNLTAARQHIVTVLESAGPGSLARPQRYVKGEADIRYMEGARNPIAVAEAEAKTPIVGRMLAFGAQGGRVGGPYLVNDGGGTQDQAIDWKRTQPVGSSRHIGGTGNGGWAWMPPEVDLSDIDSDFAPSGLTLSRVYMVGAPGTRWGSGIPELARGGLRSGFSWGHPDGAASTDYAIYKHSSAGVATEFLRFSAQPTGNKILGAPSDGSTGVATLRAMVVADIPAAALPASQDAWSVLGSLLGATTYYAAPGGGLAVVEYKFPVTRACTLKNLFVNVTDAPTGAETLTLTIRKNGSDTAVVVVLTGAATSGSDTTHSASFAQGDLVSVSVVTSPLAAPKNVTMGFERNG